MTTVTFGPLERLAIGGGDTGVWMFFALSGYLLYRPFLKGRVDLRSYAVKRAARILPGYYVALAAAVVATMSPLFFANPLAYLTGTFTYLPLRDFFGPAWTLSAEVLFYLTLPLIARAARGREALVLGGLAIASMLPSLVRGVSATRMGDWYAGSYPTVFYAFVPGMLLAAVELHRPDLFAHMAKPLYLVLGVMLVALGSLSTVLTIPVATLLGTPLVMAWLLQHRLPFPAALAFAGGSSYALYLWNWEMLKTFGLVGLVITFIGAALSWQLVERPVLARALALSDRWHRRARELDGAARAPGIAAASSE